MINQTISLDIPLVDDVLALLLLGSLPDSWETLVVTLGNSTPQGKLTLDTLKSSLLNEEAIWKERDSNFEDNALGTKKHCGSPYHYERDCRRKREEKNGIVDNSIATCDGFSLW